MQEEIRSMCVWAFVAKDLEVKCGSVYVLKSMSNINDRKNYVLTIKIE